jgi:hypothetical protein
MDAYQAIHRAGLIPAPSRVWLSCRSMVRQIDQIGLAKVSRDADLPPRLVLSNLAAGTVLGKINCTGTKEQMRGQTVRV